MRTLIDLTDRQVAGLADLAKSEERSRAALIRQAIDDYLAKRRSEHDIDAFGLWGEREVDGLVYQKKVRDEW